MLPPDDTPHRLALWRLVQTARAIAMADGANGELERIYLESRALGFAVSEAREHARIAGRGRWRDAWTLLAFDTFTLPDEESRALDRALEPFASRIPYEDEPDDDAGDITDTSQKEG